MVTANVFDPISDQLDQRVFNGTTPKTSVIKFITNLYDRAFFKEFGVHNDGYVHMYLTGSLTTYQYGPSSDCDISAFPNYQKLFKLTGQDANILRKRLIQMNIEHLDGTFLPGGSHPIQVFALPDGAMPQDRFAKGVRSGWDFQTKEWLVPPEKNRVHNIDKEFPEVYARAAGIADKMTEMLDMKNYKAADKLWNQVHRKRQLDQQHGGGDFSDGNIVYKFLVHEGIVQRLRDEMHLQIETKVAVDWSGDLDPRELDNRDGGMEVWERLEEQVEQLAKTYHAEIMWTDRSQLTDALHMVMYDIKGFEPDNLEHWSVVQFPHITGERSYFTALHEIGHAAFARIYNQPFNNNSQEEESYAWHFALENSQIPFGEDTLQWAHSLWQTYGDYQELSDTAPGWYKEVDHRQMNQERATNQWPAMNPKYPWYSTVVNLDTPVDDWHGVATPNRIPWIYSPDYKKLWVGTPGSAHLQMMYLEDEINDDSGSYERAWEGCFVPKSKEVVIYSQYDNENFTPEQIPQELVNELRSAFGDVEIEYPDVDGDYVKLAAIKPITMKVIYDPELDHIILGTQAEATKGKTIVGEYHNDEVTLQPNPYTFLNANYFRRLWGFSFPHRPLNRVHIQDGIDGNKIELPTKPPRHLHHANSISA